MMKREKGKQYVVSARITKEGLQVLNELKVKFGVGWDTLTVDALCTHYGLDRVALALSKVDAGKLPKVEKPKGTAKGEAESPAEVV